MYYFKIYENCLKYNWITNLFYDRIRARKNIHKGWGCNLMYVAKYESAKTGISDRLTKFKRGDRVLTNNSKTGTVVRLKKDELGEYFVVQLDTLSGEYAYDAWDLKRL